MFLTSLEENLKRGDLTFEEVEKIKRKFENDVLDFGDVIFGETGTLDLVLRNEGALSTLYYCKNS